MYIPQRDVCIEYQTPTLHMIDSLHVYTIENTHCKPILNKKIQLIILKTKHSHN